MRTSIAGRLKVATVTGKLLCLFAINALVFPGAFCQFFESGKSPGFHVGIEKDTNFYRYATGYREELIPTYNTSREARRSVVSGGLFSIVSFDNVPCNSDSLEVGTCYSNRECKILGGTSSGICAGNYGTCCVLRQTCGSTITTNNTYFVNPDYPSTSTGPLSCSITIQPMSGVSEIYLEFINFNIRGPTSGQCLNDTFTVSTMGSTTTYPAICGNNTGQMLYFPVGTGPTTLTFNLPTGTDARFWKIRVVQFHATDACAAPPGCLQWYRDASGVFESFNYNAGAGELITANNFCYNACFKVTSPNCGVVLTEGQFMIPGVAPSDCTEGDYLLIGGTRYCGDTLNNGMIIANSTMTSVVGGYAQVQVCVGTSNADMDAGFSLNYTPLPCSMTG